MFSRHDRDFAGFYLLPLGDKKTRMCGRGRALNVASGQVIAEWSAELTTKWIKRGTHRSVRQLVRSIRTCITNWNDVPKPFVWHKTPDEILDSLAAHYQRIGNSGH